MKKGIGLSPLARFPYAPRVLRTLLQPASRGVLVLSGRTLACGRGVRITLAGTFVDRGEGRHAPKRHRQRQHQRRDQQRNTLSHRFSPPFLLSKNKNRPQRITL